MLYMTDRRTQLSKIWQIPKTEGGQILPYLCDSVMTSIKFE